MDKIIMNMRQRIRERLQEKFYRYLMRPRVNFKGRKLFDESELRLLHQALLSQNLFGIDGKMVSQFETEFAKSYGVPYAVASTSGTAALHTALGALDLNPGDEIITAPITDLGTIIPILYQQCIPVFADVNETCSMDAEDVKRKITSKTKAIIVVHLFGNPCPMDEIAKIAKEHKIPLIEDCSQAHFTEYKGKYVGTLGDIGCFSFQQSKHMTTGDGGMTITSNKDYYERMKLFVDKGYARKGWGARAYLFLAPNYRMNELTAAVGLAQLKKVKKVIETRRELARYLTELLQNTPGVTALPTTQGANSSYWLYAMNLNGVSPEAFAQEMKKEKIIVSAGYTGKPIYLCSDSLTIKKTFGDSQFPFNSRVTDKKYEYKEGLCPRAESALNHLVCIHFHEGWSRSKIEQTANAVKKCLQGLAKPAGVQAKPVILEKREPAEVKNCADKVRVGIVGCGQMGRWHADAYKKNPLVQVVGFVDTDLEKAQKLAQSVNGKVFKSHREMIQHFKLDGVSICTVPATHRDIAVDFLNAGIHVLCEKPLAISLEQAQEMTREAHRVHKLLLTAFKFRFFEEVLAAKALLEKESLGRILSFRIMFGGYIDMTGSWYGRKEISGGGIIIDNGPHAIDLVRYLFGDIESATATVGHFQNMEVEDTAQIICVLKDNSKGVIDLSWSTSIPAKSYLEIYGEDGTILLDTGGMSYKFKTWDDWKRVNNQKSIKEAFALQIDHFVQAILTQNPVVVVNEDGLKAQEIIEAIYDSSGENKLESLVN